MIRWRFYDNNPVREMLEQVLQAAAQQPASQGGEPMPINVHQTDTDLVLEASLPGVTPDDIDISYSEGLLTLRARSHVEAREYFHQEIRSIEYLRQIMLPVECRFSEATANFEHGLLEVRIPKQQPKAPEKIQIQVNRRVGPTTIEATKGVGYSEIKAGGPPAARPAKPARKKASGGAEAARKAGPGSRSGPAR